jgi:putative tricarboxylic transport membrane protein
MQMLLLKPAGFSIATGLLFAATARGFGRGPLWLTVPAGVVFALLVWIVFAKGLSLNLPAGPLESLF